jgi:hypothetical protein
MFRKLLPPRVLALHSFALLVLMLAFITAGDSARKLPPHWWRKPDQRKVGQARSVELVPVPKGESIKIDRSSPLWKKGGGSVPKVRGD